MGTFGIYAMVVVGVFVTFPIIQAVKEYMTDEYEGA